MEVEALSDLIEAETSLQKAGNKPNARKLI